jgi:signal peptidase I
MKERIFEIVRKTKNFLKEDSWASFFVNLILALIVIKFIIFPALSFVTGTALPIVIVESCSMYHQVDLDIIIQESQYKNLGLSLENTSSWIFKNGFSKGDIIFVVRPTNLKIGDVIIFDSGKQAYPIIHRIIKIDSEGKITTKGDNNLNLLPFEQNINSSQVIGKAVFKIPYLGWVKLIFFDWRNDASHRGFC